MKKLTKRISAAFLSALVVFTTSAGSVPSYAEELRALSNRTFQLEKEEEASLLGKNGASTEEMPSDEEIEASTEETAGDEEIEASTEETAGDEQIEASTEEAAGDEEIETSSEEAAGDEEIETSTEGNIGKEGNEASTEETASKGEDENSTEEIGREGEEAPETGRDGIAVSENRLSLSGNVSTKSNGEVSSITLKDGMKITVSGIPSGCSVKAVPLSEEELLAYMSTIYDYEVMSNEALGINLKFAYDIIVLGEDGTEPVLSHPVEVRFENAGTDELYGNDSYEIYHVTDEEDKRFEKMETEIKEDTAVFSTDSFSPYIGAVVTYDSNKIYSSDEPYLKSNGKTGSQYFSYTGKVQTWTAPQNGLYHFEAIGGGPGGADGSLIERSGAATSSVGYGGYTSVYLNLHEGDTIYVAVGGAGTLSTSTTVAAGGWNGGGSAFYGGGSGGGATAFMSKLTGDGTLGNYVSDRTNVIAVAGGAGGLSASKHYFGYGHYFTSGGGGETIGETRTYNDELVMPAVNSTSYYRFGKGNNGQAVTYGNEGTVYGSGGGGGGYYGGLSTEKYVRYQEVDVKGAWSGTGGTGFYNLDPSCQYPVLDITGARPETKQMWMPAESSVEDIKYGNGEAAINYISPIKSQVTLNLGEVASFGGESGNVRMDGEEGKIIDLSGATPKGEGTIIGWTALDKNGSRVILDNQFTCTEFDTVLTPLVYDDIPIQSEQKTGEPEYRDYLYKNNIHLEWEEESNNNDKTFKAYQSIDGGEFTEVEFSEYTTTIGENLDYKTPEEYTYQVQVPGVYYVELYGGSGGSDGGFSGGKGAYMRGYVTLKVEDELKFHVGGGGESTHGDEGTVSKGGYNGGGNAVWSGAGGGRSDLYLNGVLIAAAAGGGGSTNTVGGKNAALSTGSDSGTVDDWKGEGHSDTNHYYTSLDAGGGGAGYAKGGKLGNGESTTRNDECNVAYRGAATGGYGGKSGYNPEYFTLLTEKIASSGSGYAAHDGGQNGRVLISRPSVKIYQEESADFPAPDQAAPNKPYGGKLESYDNSLKTALVSWKEPDDNGTDYRYKVNAYSIGSDAELGRSNVTDDLILSGTVAYYYFADSEPSGTVTKSDTFTETRQADVPVILGEDSYLHVAAVDKAGNLGETYHYKIDTPSALYTKSGTVTWVDHDNKHGIRPKSDTIYLYEDGVKTAEQKIDTSENVASYTFTDLSVGHTYTVSQENVPLYDVSQNDWDFVNTFLLSIQKEVLDESGKDIDGELVEVGQILTYRISMSAYADGNHTIPVYDQLPDEVAYISSNDSVTIISTSDDFSEFNRETSPNGDPGLPEGFHTDTPIAASRISVGDGKEKSFSFQVKVNETMEAEHIFNTAHGILNLEEGQGEDGSNILDIQSNTVENIVRFDPVKTVNRTENGQMIEIGGRIVEPGDILIYQVAFENMDKGDREATITDVLPTGVEFVSADYGGSYDEGTRTVTWKVTAKPETRQYVTCNARVMETARGTIQKNIALVTLIDPDHPEVIYEKKTNEVENPVMPEPVKTVSTKKLKDADGKWVYARDELIFEITYKNPASYEQAFTIVDQVPQYTKFVSAENEGQYDASTGYVIFHRTVGGGMEDTVRFTVKVLNEGKGKRVKNIGYVAANDPDGDGKDPIGPDGPEGNPTNEVQVKVYPDPTKETPGDDEADIPENTPEEAIPEVTPDQSVPKAIQSPHTGDSFPVSLLFYLALMVSGCGVLIFAFRRAKKK